MSESNHVFTIDNRFISYSVYEQALKDIEALKKSEIITNVYIKQIAWVVGIVAGIVISYVLGFKILGI